MKRTFFNIMISRIYRKIMNNKISCEICDEWVTMANRQDGEGAGSIWVCNECDIKYPRWKKQNT